MLRKVLLVEDELDHVELIRRAFESQAGHVRLNVAPSLQAAEKELEEDPPDLVIVDLVLPDGDGVELLSYTERGPLPIMIMTSQGNEEAAVDAIKAGALNYVVKSEETFFGMPQIAEGALREWRHVTERKRTEAALQASERRYRTLYDDNPAMFFTVDRTRTVVSVNRFAAEQLGYGVEELVGRPFSSLCRREDEDLLDRHFELCLQEPDSLHRWEICQESRDGSALWVRATARTVRAAQGELVVLMVCEDITEAQRLSDKLSFQSRHDPLTSLHNRREFEHRLERALEEARQDHAEHALCYLDLDQFKVINDTCGHMAGDMLLRKLGGLLQKQVRKGDILARLGGDEFGVLIKHCAPRDAVQVAESLRRTITDFRFVWEDKTFSLGVSIGLVPVDETSAGITDLLTAADSACYAAKDRGRNRIHVYHDGDADLAKRRGEMRWVAHIHKALEEDRFRLSYQPIVPVTNGSHQVGTHYEVLIRMVDEEQKLVGPGTFLPAAERYNLVSRLDQWVVETTFQWLEAHPEHLERLHMCSINLSGHSLGNRDFLDSVTSRLRGTNVPPDKICFEITETAAITNLASAEGFMHSLKELGCRFALDDFGSGLSSFAYLKNLPVDFLKIDGVFVRNIAVDPIDLAVVSSINEIGHVMGKETIAEFVEDSHILDKLRQLGVDYAQGYGIGRPQPFHGMA